MAKFLLQHPDEYKVRAVTRNPDSDAAKALQAKGAEVVQADLTVPSSLPQALQGCWGIFGVTNFYDGEVFYHPPPPFPSSLLLPLILFLYNSLPILFQGGGEGR